MASTRAKNNWKISDFVAHGSNVNCLALSPTNGHMLATGGDDRRVNLWLVGKPNNIMSISGITSPIQSVVFNNSENWIGAGSKSGIVKVFDLEGNRDVRTISGHKAAITSLDFHLYGDILASGSMDTNLKVWDARRKGCLFTYKGHTEAVKDIKFSPDGQWVVSASSDATVKVWNLIAGKMIADFKLHSGPVTSVQFHPRELLMASGSVDKTVKFYDLDRLEVVSESSPESHAVRKVLFHESSAGSAGSAGLLAGTEESLKVYGWEPARVFDLLPVHWGKVEDMIICGDQLIAASIAQTNVNVWCIDIKNLRPFSGDSSTVSGDAPPLSASGRGQFVYEKKEISPPSSAQSSRDQKRKESAGKDAAGKDAAGKAAASEDGNEEENSPPTDKDRREIFAARQKMVRTPPKKFKPPFSADPLTSGHPGEAQNDPFHDLSEGPLPTSPPSGLNRVQRIHEPSSTRNTKAESENVNYSSEMAGIRRLHGDDDPLRPDLHQQQQQQQQLEPAAVRKPQANLPQAPTHARLPPISQPSRNPVYPTPHHYPGHPSAQPPSYPPQPRNLEVKNPSRVMIEDFVPPKPTQPQASIPSSASHVSESRITADIITNHLDVTQILESRLHTLEQVRSRWSISNPRVSVELAIDSNNISVLVDLLNLLHQKRSLWTLDLALLVLPELKTLICSKYKLYAACGCNIIRLILKSFGPVIKTNVISPPVAGGRDLQREERFEKCQQCCAHLMSLREEAGRIVREAPGSSIGKLIREQALLTAFNCLD